MASRKDWAVGHMDSCLDHTLPDQGKLVGPDTVASASRADPDILGPCFPSTSHHMDWMDKDCTFLAQTQIDLECQTEGEILGFACWDYMYLAAQRAVAAALACWDWGYRFLAAHRAVAVTDLAVREFQVDSGDQAEGEILDRACQELRSGKGGDPAYKD